MAELRRKSFTAPDETLCLPGIDEAVVELAGFTVAKIVQAPGWVWSRDFRPLIDAGEFCEIRHVGLVLSGRWGARLRDGSTMEFGPDDVFDVPPGHYGYTIGDEPCLMYEFGGVRSFIRPWSVMSDRVLATLLFTDLVGSTEKARELGDAAWRELLADHLVATRGLLERFRGREVSMRATGSWPSSTAPPLRSGAPRPSATRRAARGCRCGRACTRGGRAVRLDGARPGGARGVADHERCGRRPGARLGHRPAARRERRTGVDESATTS
jgi:hypothetical protein